MPRPLGEIIFKKGNPTFVRLPIWFTLYALPLNNSLDCPSVHVGLPFGLAFVLNFGVYYLSVSREDGMRYLRFTALYANIKFYRLGYK